MYQWRFHEHEQLVVRLIYVYIFIRERPRYLLTQFIVSPWKIPSQKLPPSASDMHKDRGCKTGFCCRKFQYQFIRNIEICKLYTNRRGFTRVRQRDKDSHMGLTRLTSKLVLSDIISYNFLRKFQLKIIFWNYIRPADM